MRDTKQEDKEFTAVMDLIKNLSKAENNPTQTKLKNGVWGMLYLCIPVLTISTVLWQWLG